MARQGAEIRRSFSRARRSCRPAQDWRRAFRFARRCRALCPYRHSDSVAVVGAAAEVAVAPAQEGAAAGEDRNRPQLTERDRRIEIFVLRLEKSDPWSPPMALCRQAQLRMLRRIPYQREIVRESDPLRGRACGEFAFQDFSGRAHRQGIDQCDLRRALVRGEIGSGVVGERGLSEG